MVLRQKFWIDHSVQGVLIGRIVLYWTVGLLYLGLGSACFQYYAHPDWSIEAHAWALFQQIWPWIPSLVLFMPLVIYDIIRLSNLFAGPIYRLRMHLDEVIENPECRPLTFREDDYWQDLVKPMNYLQNEIIALREALRQTMAAAALMQQRAAEQEAETRDSNRDPSDTDLRDQSAFSGRSTAAELPV